MDAKRTEKKGNTETNKDTEYTPTENEDWRMGSRKTEMVGE